MRVFLVEDDKSVASGLKTMIAGWGFDIDAAETAAEALTQFAAVDYDVAIVDIFLPDATAYDLIPQFLEINPDVKIVAITGYATDELVKNIMKLKVDHFMTKPFAGKDLKQILELFAA